MTSQLCFIAALKIWQAQHPGFGQTDIWSLSVKDDSWGNEAKGVYDGLDKGALLLMVLILHNVAKKAMEKQRQNAQQR